VDEPYAASARELDASRPLRSRLRSAARRGALTALATVPRRPTRGVRIVQYHWVFDDELANFARQIEWLRTTFEPVSLSEAVNRLRNSRTSGRELVVTFDDGFRTQAAKAAPLLVEAGIQACFFLITGLISAPPAEARRICRDRLHLPRPVEPMTWADAERLLELGHEVGSHTRTHPNLAALDADALADELSGSREDLEHRLGVRPRHVSAPYGDPARFAPAVAAAALEAGYASCSTAQRGRSFDHEDVFALRRDHLVASWPLREVRYFLA
jgi:peptidoglycan/xylan/chitin deacetylase (PgdA/CDA1 family)